MCLGASTQTGLTNAFISRSNGRNLRVFIKWQWGMFIITQVAVDSNMEGTEYEIQSEIELVTNNRFAAKYDSQPTGDYVYYGSLH